MVTWQIVVLAQILVGSLMAVWTRHVSIKSRQYAFSVALISYACIATMGFLYSVLHTKGLPPIPEGRVWLFLIAEGMLIPAFWLFNFKLVSHIGASNGVLASTLYGLGVATLGVVFLDEAITLLFIVGAAFMLTGIYVSLTIKPDETHVSTASLNTKILLLVGAFVCFSFGIFFEKQAITLIGPWDYAMYGWFMQFVGATILYLLFGKRKLLTLPKRIWKKAIILGVLTSVAGLLFVLALSLGTLSQTVIATSGKITVTMVLAAIFLHERNNMPLRLLAFALTMFGVFLVIS